MKMTKYELLQQLYTQGTSRNLLPCYLKFLLERIEEAK